MEDQALRAANSRGLSLREQIAKILSDHPFYFKNVEIIKVTDEGTPQEAVYLRAIGLRAGTPYEGGVFEFHTVVPGQFHFDTPIISRSVLNGQQFFWSEKYQREDRLTYVNKRFTCAPGTLAYHKPTGNFQKTYGNEEIDKLKQNNFPAFWLRAYEDAVRCASRLVLCREELYTRLSAIANDRVEKLRRAVRHQQEKCLAEMQQQRHPPLPSLAPSLYPSFPEPPDEIEFIEPELDLDPIDLDDLVCLLFLRIIQLPSELWTSILAFVDIRSVLSLLCVSKSWRALSLQRPELLQDLVALFGQIKEEADQREQLWDSEYLLLQATRHQEEVRARRDEARQRHLLALEGIRARREAVQHFPITDEDDLLELDVDLAANDNVIDDSDENLNDGEDPLIEDDDVIDDL